MPRIKSKPAIVIATRLQADQTVGQVGAIQRRLNSCKIEMDERIASIREQYESEIDKLEFQLAKNLNALEDWGRANPDEFPAGRKTLEFTHGAIGFRTGTPKVKVGKKFKSLKKVAEAMRALPWARKYIKQAAPTVNREALIADRDKLTIAQLNELGLTITQDETFFVEPKAEQLEQGAVAA